MKYGSYPKKVGRPFPLAEQVLFQSQCLNCSYYFENVQNAPLTTQRSRPNCQKCRFTCGFLVLLYTVWDLSMLLDTGFTKDEK